MKFKDLNRAKAAYENGEISLGELDDNALAEVQKRNFKNPLKLANEIEKTAFDENKYNEMIDFIANQRANNISLPNVKEMMDKKYGSNYKDMIEYAFSKWAE